MDNRASTSERASDGDAFYVFNPSSINSGIRRLGSKLKFHKKRGQDGSRAAGAGDGQDEASSSHDHQPATPRGIASDSAATAVPPSPAPTQPDGTAATHTTYASDGGGGHAGMARRFSAGFKEGLDALDPAAMARRSSAGLRRSFNAIGSPSVARARALVMSPKQLWHKQEGQPPEGYLWAWLGRLRRWKRRWFVAHTVGLLQVYKSSRLDGKVWNISLRDASAQPDATHSRQLHIVVGNSLVYLRAQDSVNRDAWVQHLQWSIDEYSRSRSRIAGLGMLPGLPLPAAAPDGKLPAADGQLPKASAGVSSGLALLELLGVDPEMRVKIRHRVAERWADIQGPQAEFERQVAQLQTMATALASSLSLSPSPTALTAHASGTSPHSHISRQSPSYGYPAALPAAAAAARPPGGSAITSIPLPAAGRESSKPRSRSRPATSAAHAAGGAHAGAHTDPKTAAQTAQSATKVAAEGNLGQASTADRDSAHPLKDATSSGVATAVAPAEATRANGLNGSGHPGATARQLAGDTQPPVTGASSSVRHSAPVRRRRSVGAESAAGAGSSGSWSAGPAAAPAAAGTGGQQQTHAGGLQQAYTQLLGAFREALQREAMRSVELEGELQLLRQRVGGVAAKRLQKLSASATAGSTAATAAGGAAAGSAAVLAGRRRSASRRSRGSSRRGGAGSSDDRPRGDADGSSSSSGSSEYLSFAGGGSSVAGDAGVLAELELMMGTLDGTSDDEGGVPGPKRGDGEGGVSSVLGPDGLACEPDVLSALEVVRQVEFASRDSSATQLLADAGSVPPSQARAARMAAAGAAGTVAGAAAAAATAAEAAAAGGTSHLVPRSGSGGLIEDDEDMREGDNEEDEGEEGLGGNNLGAAVAVRQRLPAPKPIGRGFSIWSVLKNAMGGDLTKITMPATINEPLSFIQRLAEMMEYQSLLEKALAQPHAPERMLWMAAWCMSPYSSQPFREGKPFNPLLGETYEWRSPDGQHRFITEQVSHHPPISAYQSEGLGGTYIGSGELETKSRFWGKSIEIILAGNERLTDTVHQEVYEWNRFNVSVNDLILGRFWPDVYGDVKIVNRTTGHHALLQMRPCKGNLELRGRITGTICAPDGTALYQLHGSICSRVLARAADGSGGWGEAFVIYEPVAWPEDWAEQYNMTRFAIGLNDPCCSFASSLPPTDSRFRPDQRALELGEHALATSEKLRLEDKQRAARRARKARGDEYRPRWFAQTDPSDRELIKLAHVQPGQSAWMFNGHYWDTHGSWGGSPDIYSPS